MKITHAADIPVVQATTEYFTGTVTMEPLHRAEGPSGPNAVRVQFEPGARTNWHTHPQGQLLIVLEGEGWVQVAGQPRSTIRPGDVVWFEADERHWHGATAGTAMVHIATQGSVNGKTADWAEAVSDDDYRG